VRVQVRDPCGRGTQSVGRGAEFRARLALPTCEARIELLNGAGPRAIFGARWAVPGGYNRANKQLVLQISRSGWNSVG
jgi:hypothetical protein